MAKTNKYGVRDLEQEFPNDQKCLGFIFSALHSKECSCGGHYSLIKGRKQYQCSKCRFQIAPLSGTIFHKSDTPLSLWFKAILSFSNAKSGLSAKYLERELNVTYKTAWRMLKLIRQSFGQGKDKLKGKVEMDETWYGGRGKAGKDNEKLSEVMKKKAVIMGAIERGGSMKAQITPNARARSVGKFLIENVQNDGTLLLTDGSNRYKIVVRIYDRKSVNHKKKEYARGEVHTNSIEGFWSHFKRSTKGTHKVISQKYLQSYLDGFVFHRGMRHNDRERFSSLMSALVHA